MNSVINKPWGSYKVLYKDTKYLIKKITVKKNAKLSLQSHNYRSEHWVIVKGIAEVTLDKKIFNLNVNENIFIPKKTKHRLSNNQSEDLEIIEVWFGEILDEDDIVRYEDIYNRIKSDS